MVQGKVDLTARQRPEPEMFRLTQNTTDVEENSDTTCENWAIRYSFAPIWKYQVPVAQEFIILPSHRLSVYLEDDTNGAAEWRDDQQVRIEAWDATERRMQIIYQGRYVESKEEQDDEKMARFDLLEEPLHLRSGDLIVVAGKCASTVYTIDVSDSRFSIELLRVRLSLY